MAPNHSTMPLKVPVVLAVGGSDPSGGAGIQADVRTLTSLGVYGAAIPTAITVQDTRRVYEVVPCPPDLIRRQLDRLLDDLRIDVVKIGMVATPEIAQTVAVALAAFQGPVVLDPMLISSSGYPLLPSGDPGPLAGLLARADVATPNVQEAAQLSSIAIVDEESMAAAAGAIAAAFTCKAVIIKGGHLYREPINLLLHEGRVTTRRSPRLNLLLTHGTGCCFASALAGFISHGQGLIKAFEAATDCVHQALRNAISPGHGAAIPSLLDATNCRIPLNEH
jgi:hydroxymethylpyrimidine/phosphomethylpyrimidine kinase